MVSIIPTMDNKVLFIISNSIQKIYRYILNMFNVHAYKFPFNDCIYNQFPITLISIIPAIYTISYNIVYLSYQQSIQLSIQFPITLHI